MAGSIHPRWKETVRTYLSGNPLEVIEIPLINGVIDLDFLCSNLTPDTAAVLVQHPNFFGYLEPLEGVAEKLEKHPALWVMAADPVSLGLLAQPGEWGADIAVGELQSLGLPLSFGGPYAGYFTARNQYMRQMPGRIVGRTVDADGQTGYVLTLQTREQHIRRDKATSNICTNQSHCALAATLYLAMMGPDGLAEVARQNHHKSAYLREKLITLPGISEESNRPFFNEFTLRLPVPAKEVFERAQTYGQYPGIADCSLTGDPQRLIVCVTETKKQDDLEEAVETFKMVLGSFH
jgi:glycine dehydrogenase subunit 1